MAEHRLGKTGQLGNEFIKTNGSFVWARRMFWMVAGHTLLLLVGSTIGAFVNTARLTAAVLGLDPTLVATLGASLSVVFWLGLFRLLFSTANGTSTYLRSLALMSSQWSAVWLSAIVLLVYALGSVLKVASQIEMTRFIRPEDFGQMAMANAYFEFIWSPLFVVICVLTLVSLRRKVCQPSTE